jgi:hypothetical protein
MYQSKVLNLYLNKNHQDKKICPALPHTLAAMQGRTGHQGSPALMKVSDTELLVVPLNYQWFRKTSKGSAYIVRNRS